jgi:hypothetical protein
MKLGNAIQNTERKVILKRKGGNFVGCIGRVYKSKKWAKRFHPDRKITKVKGGYKIGKKK